MPHEHQRLLSAAELAQRASELKAYAALAPTPQARTELNRLAVYYANLVADSEELRAE
jgi:hypothetical protein